MKANIGVQSSKYSKTKMTRREEYELVEQMKQRFIIYPMARAVKKLIEKDETEESK